jgi:hypothetical protein
MVSAPTRCFDVVGGKIEASVPRIFASLRWLAPSAIAACAGALVAGAIDGSGTGGALGAIAAAGFVAIVAVPILVVASAATRGVWAAWRPRELVARATEDGGGAPRFAAWAIVAWLAIVGLAWAAWQSVLLLGLWTEFHVVPVSLAMPAIVVAVAIALVALAKPVALGLAIAIRKLDARWRRRGRRSLATPRRVLLAIAIVSGAGAYVAWRLYAKDQLGPLDLGVVRAPLAAIATCAIVHAARGRGARVRRAIGWAIAIACALAIAVAAYARLARPALVLAIWGDRPVAGLAIDLVFDLDAIRDQLPLAALAPQPRADAPHPDIILVTIDTVRADHTPPYAGTAEMPNLQLLAARGAVFDWAFSPSNVTRRSVPSMMIGLAPNRVRGRVTHWALRLDPRHVLVAERLAAGGYETAGFMCCDHFWDPKDRTGWSRGLQHLEIEPRENGFALAKRARTWLEAREASGDTRPLFVWMHLLEPHNWEQGIELHNDEERRRAYDRTLHNADLMLGDLLAAFAKRPADRAPIVIVTADHGEALGDHGQPKHSTDLYDSQIRVPLVIAGPGIVAGRIAETVSLTALAPSLVELAGFVAPPDAADAASFADLATGRRAPTDEAGVAFAAMIKDRSNPGGVVAIVRGRWKLIDSPSGIELYDTRADPGERSNVIGTRLSLADELKTLLKRAYDAGDVSPFD